MSYDTAWCPTRKRPPVSVSVESNALSYFSASRLRRLGHGEVDALKGSGVEEIGGCQLR